MKKLLIILSFLIIVSTVKSEFIVTGINGVKIPPTSYTVLVPSTNKTLSAGRMRKEELLKLRRSTNAPTSPKNLRITK